MKSTSENLGSRRFTSLLGTAGVLATLAAGALWARGSSGSIEATAKLAGCEDKAISGSVRLVEHGSSEGVKLVDVEIEVQGMKPGKHAVHIHQTGACKPCSAAQGHFDPGPFGENTPDKNHPMHMGDLINIEVGANGRGKLRTTTNRVTLSPGPLSVFDQDGSALIVHVDPDTYCPEGEEKGCAGGARAACGILQPKGSWSKSMSSESTTRPARRY